MAALHNLPYLLGLSLLSLLILQLGTDLLLQMMDCKHECPIWFNGNGHWEQWKQSCLSALSYSQAGSGLAFLLLL